MQEEAEKYWNSLTIQTKNKFLQIHKFWDGYKHFIYKYLPDELKQIIMQEIGYK